MPVRIASFTRRLSDNGRALHRAMASRTAAGGAEPSESETALIEERRLLKEERDKRRAQALLPGPSALDRLVRTHHPEAKDKDKDKGRKAKPEAQDAGAKKAKPHKTRAEKHAEKAAALEAARRAPKKPAK